MSAQRQRSPSRPRLIKALDIRCASGSCKALNEGVASPSRAVEEAGEPLGNVKAATSRSSPRATRSSWSRPRRCEEPFEHFYQRRSAPISMTTTRPTFRFRSPRRLSTRACSSIWNHLAEAAKAGTLGNDLKVTTQPDRPSSSTSRPTRMADRLKVTLETAIELQAESIGRLDRSCRKTSARRIAPSWPSCTSTGRRRWRRELSGLSRCAAVCRRPPLPAARPCRRSCPAPSRCPRRASPPCRG